MKEVMAEIAKCELRCSNCHSAKSYERLTGRKLRPICIEEGCAEHQIYTSKELCKRHYDRQRRRV